MNLEAKPAEVVEGDRGQKLAANSQRHQSSRAQAVDQQDSGNTVERAGSTSQPGPPRYAGSLAHGRPGYAGQQRIRALPETTAQIRMKDKELNQRARRSNSERLVPDDP